MTPLKNFQFIHFGMQLFQGIGGGSVVAPPVPPGGGGGSGSGAFDAAKYRRKTPKEPEWFEQEPNIVCVRAHHIGAHWGTLTVTTSKSVKPTNQQMMIVAAFIAQHGSP